MDEERLLELLQAGCRLHETKYRLAARILGTRDFRHLLPLASEFIACDVAEDNLNLELMEAFPVESAEAGLAALYGREPEESCRNLLHSMAVKANLLAVLEQARPEQPVCDLFTARLARSAIRRIREYARQYLREATGHRL